MAIEFKVGDIVVLKSGSPKMTVESVSATSTLIRATWFSGSKHNSETFNPGAIELAPKGDAKK